MIFGPIIENTSLLRERKADGIGRRGFAPVMDRLGPGKENYLPPRFPTTPAPIHIIAIHEHLFIQKTHGIKRFSTDKGKATHEHMHLDRSVMGKVEHMLTRKEAGILELRRQAGGVAKIIPQSRESPASA